MEMRNVKLGNKVKEKLPQSPFSFLCSFLLLFLSPPAPPPYRTPGHQQVPLSALGLILNLGTALSLRGNDKG